MNTKKIPRFQCILHVCRHKAHCIYFLDWNMKNPTNHCSCRQKSFTKAWCKFWWHYHKGGRYGAVLQTSPFQMQSSVNMQRIQQRGLNTNFAEEGTTGHINCRLQGMWSIFISKCWLLLTLLQVPGTEVEHKGNRGKCRWLKSGASWSSFFSFQTD